MRRRGRPPKSAGALLDDAHLKFFFQSLPIEVSSSREIDEIELDEDEYECCSINISSSTSRNHNHQSSDFSIQTLVSTSREISLDCLDESSHHVFTCTAYACRTWISHMLFTLLPIVSIFFQLFLLFYRAKGTMGFKE